ncbi:PHD finger protein 3 isoform X2 [Nematostella vectensis]|uniref:PHD finger protein 3 isoform X2 n=1 Tax=Nematostella vectensis TaxID=45351 RepID=UPI0013905D1E|nr:PHD finger protein 3 isoform X2 [Nematostella vectensis]
MTDAMADDIKSESLPKENQEGLLEPSKAASDPNAGNVTGSSVWNLCPLPSDAHAIDLHEITPSISPVFTEDQVRELSQQAGDLDVLLPPDAFKRITEVLTPEQTNLLINTCTSHYNDSDVSMSYADPLLGNYGQFSSSPKRNNDPILPDELHKMHEGLFDLQTAHFKSESKIDPSEPAIASGTISTEATSSSVSTSQDSTPEVTSPVITENKDSNKSSEESKLTSEATGIKLVKKTPPKQSNLTPPKPTYSLRSSPRKGQAIKTDESPSRNARQKGHKSTPKSSPGVETRRSPRGAHSVPRVEETTSPNQRKGRKKQKTEEESPKETPKVTRRSTRAHPEPDTATDKSVPESPRRGRGRRKQVTSSPKDPAEDVSTKEKETSRNLNLDNQEEFPRSIESQREEPCTAEKPKGEIQEDKIDSSVTLPCELQKDEEVNEIHSVDNKTDENREDKAVIKHSAECVESTESSTESRTELTSKAILSTEEETSGAEEHPDSKKKQKRKSKEDLQPSRRSNRIHESVRKREIEEAVRIAQEEMRREREEEENRILEEEERVKREEEEKKAKEVEEKRMGEDEEQIKLKEEEVEIKEDKTAELELEETTEKSNHAKRENLSPSKIHKKDREKTPTKKNKEKNVKKNEEKDVQKEEEKDVQKKVEKSAKHLPQKKPESKKHEQTKKDLKGRKLKRQLSDKEKIEEIKKEKLKKVEEILSQKPGTNLFEFHKVKQDTDEAGKDAKKEESEVESSESEEEEIPGDDDSDYDPNNDPERLWCICRKPHGNRFMICCDRCDEWFHGDCIGITMSQGRQMEKSGIEYNCPKCVKAIKVEQDKLSPGESNKEISPTSRPRRHRRLKIPKDFPEHAGNTSTKSKLGEKRKHSKDEEKTKPKSSETGFKIPKKVRTTPTPASYSHHSTKCISPNCSSVTEGKSRYCSDACIARYAEDSLKVLSEERKRRQGNSAPSPRTSTSPSSSLRMPWDSPTPQTPASVRVSERIAVIEKSTGRVIAGVAAPTEGQLFYWLQKHPTFEILRPTSTPTKQEKKKEDKKEDEKSIRENVKRHLREILTSRQKESKDLHLPSDEVIKLSDNIEEDLYKLFGDAGHRYKNKYRSLAFNLKDTRNKVLFHHVLSGEVSTDRLVAMTPEQLASQELARWRERETKHNLEMIKQNQEDINPIKAHIKKTHKGEVELDEDLSTLEVHSVEKTQTAAADSNTSPGPLLTDTTEQHRLHLFDLNCRICTGKMAPPGEPQRPEEPSTVIVTTTSPILALAESSVPSPPPLDLSDVSSTDNQSALPESPTPLHKRDQPVWKGFVMMQSVAKFGTNAYKVSGPCDDLLQLFPDTLHLHGRIGFDQVWDYIYQLRSSTSRVVSVIRYEPSTDDEKTSYVSLYSYFYSRKRCGVVNNCYSGVKDMYLYPLPSHAEIPKELLPFDGPGLDEPRPHMLLGIIVRTKPSFKRPRAVSHHKSTSPKAKRRHHRHSSGSHGSGSKHKDSLKDSPPAEIDDIVFQFQSTQTKKSADGDNKYSPSQSGSEASHSPLSALMAEKQKLLGLQEQAKAAQEQANSEKTEDSPYDPEEDFDLDLELEKPVNIMIETKKSVSSSSSSPTSAPTLVVPPTSTTIPLLTADTTTSKPPSSSTSIFQAAPATTSNTTTQIPAVASKLPDTTKPPILPANLVFPMDITTSSAAELIKRLQASGVMQPPVITSSTSNIQPTAAITTSGITSGRVAEPLIAVPASSAPAVVQPSEARAQTHVSGATDVPIAGKAPAGAPPHVSSRVDPQRRIAGDAAAHKSVEPPKQDVIDRDRLEWRLKQQGRPHGPSPERWRNTRNGPSPGRSLDARDPHPDGDRGYPPRRHTDEATSQRPMGDDHETPPRRFSDNLDYHGPPRRPHDKRDSHGPPRRPVDERAPQGPQHRPLDDRGPLRRPPDERGPQGPPRRPTDERDPHAPLRRTPDDRGPHGPPRRPSDERDPHGRPRRLADERFSEPYGNRGRGGGYNNRGGYGPRDNDRRDSRRYEGDRWRDRWRR